MSIESENVLRKKKVFKLVLTGGPCGGKTTAQSRLCTFFENLGWKVYCVPETATVLLSAGVKFCDLTNKAAYEFQANLIRTMMQIEKSLFDLAEDEKRDCIFICDRGIMDATAFLSVEDWEKMKEENNWNEIALRDSRYNSVVHLISAANGAEAFYTTEGHTARSEDLEDARVQDKLAKKAWVGHHAYDVIDNSTDFEMKMQRLLQRVCSRLGIFIKNWPAPDTRKRKFLIASEPDMSNTDFHEFECEQDYLATAPYKTQARIRKRGINGFFTYTHTIRRPEINGQSVELKMQVDEREYMLLRAQRDLTRATITVKRRCFLWENQYFTLDLYQEPCPTKCRNLIILQTYTNLKGDELKLPPFLNIVKEVTNDDGYSMFNLSKINAKDLKFLRRKHGTQSMDVVGRKERFESDSDCLYNEKITDEESFTGSTLSL